MNLGVDKIEKADTFALQVMWSRGKWRYICRQQHGWFKWPSKKP